MTPLVDQLRNMKGESLDLIIETPGGLGEVAEEVVRICRSKYKQFSVIVPGWAKSAGTLIAMAGDEILMGSMSAVGPIDAQLTWQGKVFSAGELLDGMQKILEEAAASNSLNRAYVPILQGISPGEMQRAQNAQAFAKTLVTEWLANYKFRPGNWDTHSSTGLPVTPQDRIERADQIAKVLADHTIWLTHGRSIRMTDLTEMGLRITDFEQNKPLAEAISRYHALLMITFETGNSYKIFETPSSQIYRNAQRQDQSLDENSAKEMVKKTDHLFLEGQCAKCGKQMKIQANFRKGLPIPSGTLAFPKDNRVRCEGCLHVNDVSELRKQIETKIGRTIQA